MKSNPLIPALLLALCCTSAVAGTSNPKGNNGPFVLDAAKLSLTVSAEGRAKDVACDAKVEANLCSMLQRAVPGWKFTPGQRAGVASEMEINMTLSLVAVPKAGGFGVQATYAWLEPSSDVSDGNVGLDSRRLNPPVYPFDAMRRGRTGVVIVELWFQPGSEVPRVGKIWFKGQPAKPKNEFVAATLVAVSKWKIRPGTPEQLSFCVPVEYTLGGPVGNPQGSAPCVPTYADGFAPPKLLTDVTRAAL